MLTDTANNHIQWCDATTGERLVKALTPGAPVHHAEFSPDGKLVVTATQDGTVQLWNADTGEAVGSPLATYATFASFSPDGGRLAVIGRAMPKPPPTQVWSAQAQVWDVTTGQPLTKAMTINAPPSYSVCFSPDGNRLLTRSHFNQVRVWDAHTGEPITPVLTHDGSTTGIARFSPNGRSILTDGGNRAVRLCDAATGKKLTRPLEHKGHVQHAAFSPDGRRVVTCSADHTARIWDASTGLPLTPPLQHRDAANYAEFSPDGRRIVTACDDGTARVWQFETNNWPVKDLRLLAELLSGRAIDGTGSFSALAPAALKDTLQKLKSKHADYFSDSPP